MPILERAALLDELRGAWAEARAARGKLVLVGGEAGVGKTTLVTELGRTLAAEARILWGACDPSALPRPLGPIADFAAGTVRRRLDEGAAPQATFEALLAELRKPPTLLVIEDAHWADDATLSLLRYLGRRVATVPTLFVVTYRDDELGPRHPLRVALGDLATAPQVRRLTVPPLSVAATGTLAAGSGLDPAVLHGQTGGNPFFITEILSTGAPGIPATVRDAILARAARLAPAAHACLEGAAVIGARVEPGLLARLVPDHGAIDDCLAGGMLHVDRGWLAFRHELARVALLEDTPPHRRLVWHRRILDALTARGETDVAALAHHAEGAGDRPATFAHARAAARQAAQLGAHREAAAQLARALRAAGPDVPDRERAELWEERSYECQLTEQTTEAYAARREALALWIKLGDREREGDSHRFLSRTSWFLGRRDDAERHATTACSILETVPPGRPLAMAYSNRSQLAMLATDCDAAIEWGHRALAVAEPAGATGIVAHALNNIGTARLVMDDSRGWDDLERSLRIAEEAGFEDDVSRALNNLLDRAIYGRSLARAGALVERALAHSAQHDLDSPRLRTRINQAELLIVACRLSAAADVAAAILRHPSLEMLPRTTALWVLGRVRARRGEPGVDDLLDDALALATASGELQRLRSVHAARAEAAWLAGDLPRVVAEARAVLPLAVARKDVWSVAELAFWAWRGGDRNVPEDLRTPYGLQMRGLAARAAARWDELGCVYEAACARADLDDEAELRRAHHDLDALGARATADLVARRLRERGVRGIPRGRRASTKANAALLTTRELEVLELVGTGLRNVDIARRLHVSAKTVDHHVSAILGKLGVRTRTEASREALRRGMVARDGDPKLPK